MHDFAAELAIPVFLLFGLAQFIELAESDKIVSSDAPPVEKVAALAGGNVSKALQPVGGRLVAHAEMVREHGVVLVSDALRASRRALGRLDVAAARGVEDGVVLAARQPLVEVPEGSTDSGPRHEKGGGERVRALFDHFGRIVGARDRHVAVPVEEGVRVFVRVGKALPSFRMGRIHENGQPDTRMPQEKAGHAVGKRDAGCPDALGSNEFGYVGNRRVRDSKPAALLLGRLLSLCDGFSGRAGNRHVVAGRTGSVFGAQQTYERNAFPAEVNTPGDLFARVRILLQPRGNAVQGDEDITVLVPRAVMQEVGDGMQVEFGKPGQFEGGYGSAAGLKLRDGGTGKVQRLGGSLLAEAAGLARPAQS